MQRTAPHCTKKKCMMKVLEIVNVTHTATHCNALQHTATHCNALHHTVQKKDCTMKVSEIVNVTHTATHCNALHHNLQKNKLPDEDFGNSPCHSVFSTLANTARNTAYNTTTNTVSFHPYPLPFLAVSHMRIRREFPPTIPPPFHCESPPLPPPVSTVSRW